MSAHAEEPIDPDDPWFQPAHPALELMGLHDSAANPEQYTIMPTDPANYTEWITADADATVDLAEAR